MDQSPDPEPPSPRSHFRIHILRATLNTPLDSKRKLHIAVTIPSTQVLRTESLQSKPGDVRLEWNRRYEFTTTPSPSQPIKLELVIERALGRTVHGEARITIEDLLRRCQCQDTGDCSLELRKGASGKGKGKVRGYITVRLERLSANDGLTHRHIGEELSQLEQDSSFKELLRVGEMNDKDAVETIGLLLARMMPLLRVLDAVSIIPVFENAWGSVSTLYKMYQKRTFVDAEIKELVRIMHNALKFVQDTSSLKSVLTHSEETVGKLLGTIHASSQFIRDYLDVTAIGRMWRTELNIKRLEECKKRLESLRSDLYGDAIGSLTRTYKSTENKGSHVVIPPPPTEMFTGRHGCLDQMGRSLDITKASKKQWRFILYGIGGTGKTQVALKFLEKNDVKFTKRYMIDASSAESIALSFEGIGATLGIENPDISKVLTRLSQLKEDWLLLYDNADDPKLRLAPFFPKGSHGNIIVTTRNAELRSLAPNDSIEVLMLDENAAIDLLLQSGRLEETDENRRLAQILVNKFGCLALAIVQAGSYISSRRLDLPKYSKMYEKSRSTLLRVDPGQDVDYRAPVFTTWEISFAELSAHAQTLLNICAFLYRDGITEDVFRLAVTSDRIWGPVKEPEIDGSDTDDVKSQKYKELKINNIDLLPSRPFAELIDWLRNEEGEWDDFRFAELMHNLCSYSLVQSPFPGIYSIHPLVHEWARDRLGRPNRDAAQQDAWLLLFLPIRPISDNASIVVSRTLVPHISSCGLPTDVLILEAFVSVHWVCGRWKDAEALQARVVERRINEDGDGLTSALSSIGKLASIYRHQGRWTEAENLEVGVLAIRQWVLGSNHLDTLASMNNLASTYLYQGRWTEAEELQVKVLEICKPILGSDHPNTLQSMGNLASTYAKRGRWAEAEKLQVKVLEISKQMLGSDHPNTLTSMNNLASTYSNQGRWTEAKSLGLKVLETRKRMLGPDHPDTLTSMANLASTYWDQGRWIDAEKLEVEVLDKRKRTLGSHDPNTLTSMANLALSYSVQGRWAEAENLEVEVLETRMRSLGPDHPDTFGNMANLASTYRNQGRWAEAEKLGSEMLEISKQILGSDHPNTLISMANLASTYSNQGRWAEAERLEVEVLETSKRVLETDHPDILRSMANLASTYCNQGRLSEAEKLQVEVLETSKRVLTHDHPNTLMTMANLAVTYWGQRRWAEAEKLQIEVLESRKQVLGPEHPDTLVVMNNLAGTLHSQGRSNEAVTMLCPAVELSKRVYGPQHPTTLLFSKNLFLIYRTLGWPDEAGALVTSLLSVLSSGPSEPNLYADLNAE